MMYLQTASEFLVWGIVAHLVADWLFQNDWIARNKSNLRHSAGWIHGAIHFVFLLLVFPALAAVIIAVLHILIDTRAPLNFWQKFIKQTTTEPYGIHVAIWGDQVLHVAVIAVAAAIVGV